MPPSTPFIRTLLFGNFILATWFFFPDKPYSLAARKGAAKGFGSSFGPIDTRKFRARFSAVAGLIYDLVRFLS